MNASAPSSAFLFFYYQDSLLNGATFVPAINTIVMTAHMTSVSALNDLMIDFATEEIRGNIASYAGFNCATMCDGADVGFRNGEGSTETLTLVGMTLG